MMTSLGRQLAQAIKGVERQAAVHHRPEAVKLVQRARVQSANNASQDAVESLMQSVSLYQEAGFTLKVVFLLKQVLSLEPGHAEAARLLGRVESETAGAEPAGTSTPASASNLPTHPPARAPSESLPPPEAMLGPWLSFRRAQDVLVPAALARVMLSPRPARRSARLPAVKPMQPSAHPHPRLRRR